MSKDAPLYVETENGGMERLEKAPAKPPRVTLGPKPKKEEKEAD